MKKILEQELSCHLDTAKKMDQLIPQIIDLSEIMLQVFKKNNKILICGNGGSAADSQHFAAELTGRYKRERRGLGAIALSTDTSALTAIGNDYGYEYVFLRQVEALANQGDIFFGISTSGHSKNIILAMKEAKKRGCITVALGGRDGGEMAQIADFSLVVPSQDTPRIQEMHIFIIHCLCEIVERRIVDLS